MQLQPAHQHKSRLSLDERDTWATFLKQGVPLGTCTGECPEQLLAVHYDLENSRLSLLTENAERENQISQYYELPGQGSRGLIMRNQLNLSGGQEEDLGGRFALQASSSLGHWTQGLNLQLSRQGGPDDSTLYHAVYEAFTQRELEGSFLRLGYFTPTAEGLTRQIRTFGANPDTALGVMFGSSDSLAITQPKPSIYPVYVTANRQATVEIYRNGLLINTQMVNAGLQSLDTRPLPGGIYEVQVRLIEDGQITSTTPELIYKPNNWRNHDQRWRYNVFAGRELTVNDEVYQSEAKTNQHNRGIAWLLQSYGYMYADPMEVCAVYTRQCSVAITCHDLVTMGATLANGGVNPISGKRAVRANNVAPILSEMTLNGLYDTTGDWYYKVGLPGKSGVGGGILAVVPGVCAIAAFAPPLDGAGNSVRGQLAAEYLSRTLNLSLLHEFA